MTIIVLGMMMLENDVFVTVMVATRTYTLYMLVYNV